MTDPLNEDTSLDTLINKTTPVLLNEDLPQGAEIYQSPQVNWGELLAAQPKLQQPSPPREQEPVTPKLQQPSPPREQEPVTPKLQQPSPPREQEPVTPKLQQPLYIKEQESFTPKLQDPLYRPHEQASSPKIQFFETPKTSDRLVGQSLRLPEITTLPVSEEISTIETPTVKRNPPGPLNPPSTSSPRTIPEQRPPLTYQQIQAQRREAYQAERQWRREHALEIRAARAQGIRLEPPWKRPQPAEPSLDTRQVSEMLGVALRQVAEGVNLLDGSQLSQAAGRQGTPELAATPPERTRQQPRGDTAYKDTSVVRIAPGTVIRILDDRLVIE